MTWNIELKKNLKKYDNATLLIGLTGIANAGKIAIDYLTTELKTTKLGEFNSDSGPGFTFVNEENLVVLPKIELHYKKINNKDFFFVIGDYQPTEDEDIFKLTKTILNTSKKIGINEIITLGGIGLEEEPEKPKVYVAANNEKFLNKLKDLKLNTKASDSVGSIMGITGLALVLSDINAAAFLVETSAYPGHLGMNAAKKLLKTLNNVYGFKITFKNINKDLKAIKKIIEETLALQTEKIKGKGEVNYIG